MFVFVDIKLLWKVFQIAGKPNKQTENKMMLKKQSKPKLLEIKIQEDEISVFLIANNWSANTSMSYLPKIDSLSNARLQ